MEGAGAPGADLPLAPLGTRPLRTLRHREDGNLGVSGTHNRPFKAEATDYQVLKMPLASSEPHRAQGAGQEEESQREDGTYTAKMWGSADVPGVPGAALLLPTALQGSHSPG